jgi:hypothetical protein
MLGCWKAEDHYMDYLHTQPGALCGIDGTDGEVDPEHSDITGVSSQDTCTTDEAAWTDVSPYYRWSDPSVNPDDYGPVFIANGGGPYDPDHPENYDYANAETVAITDPYDFDTLLQTLDWNSSNLELCIADVAQHGIWYRHDPCDFEPANTTVIAATAEFITSHWPPP